MKRLEIICQCCAFEDDVHRWWYVEGFLQSLLPFAHLVGQHRVVMDVRRRRSYSHMLR